METQTRIKVLETEIPYLNQCYREGKQLITDAEYDSLLAELAELSPNHFLVKTSIIEKAPTTRERKLETPMYSLDKVKTVTELKKWLSSLNLSGNEMLVITPKYNGISLENNTFKGTASTRGDGEIGQNCDEHFRLMNKHSNLNNSVVIGEAIISRKNWDFQFKSKLSPRGNVYKLNNATVAGLLNSDSPTEELRFVDYIRYGIVDGEGSNMNKMLQLQEINNYSTNSVSFKAVEVDTLNEEMLDQLFHEWNKIHPIDGLVIDINRYTLREKLGRESNGNPAYAKALKLDKWSEEIDTVITGYDFQISKQGKLKGVVTFEPVIINGTEVKQASFYNARFIYDMCLFNGMPITVKKSGEVIPKIVAVAGVRIPERVNCVSESSYQMAYMEAKMEISIYSQEQAISSPLLRTCPSCGSHLHWDENLVELCCLNAYCESVMISKLEHFFLSIGVEEFGRPSIQTLYTAGYKTVSSILNITREQFASVEGFGEASADIVLNQFKQIRVAGISFAKLLYAMDVFDGKIGEKTAQLCIDGVADLFIVTVEELVKIKGVSTITAECFIKGLDRLLEDDSIDIKVSYTRSPVKLVLNASFNGFNVCFSGIRDKELEKVIEDGGGKIASGVSKTLTHLIVADVNQSTSKTVKARELGIPVMTIEQFKNL